MSTLTPFDYVKTIDNKLDKLPIGDYNAYIVNRALSHGQDTVLFANIMNMYPDLPNDIQYDFYYYAIPQKKRYNKWVKKVPVDDLDIVRKYYNCSVPVAIEYLKLLSTDQIKVIKSKMYVGGKK